MCVLFSHYIEAHKAHVLESLLVCEMSPSSWRKEKKKRFSILKTAQGTAPVFIYMCEYKHTWKMIFPYEKTQQNKKKWLWRIG